MTEDCVSLSTSSSAAYGVDPVFLSTSSLYNSLETTDGVRHIVGAVVSCAVLTACLVQWSSYYEASQISALVGVVPSSRVRIAPRNSWLACRACPMASSLYRLPATRPTLVLHSPCFGMSTLGPPVGPSL